MRREPSCAARELSLFLRVSLLLLHRPSATAAGHCIVPTGHHRRRCAVRAVEEEDTIAPQPSPPTFPPGAEEFEVDVKVQGMMCDGCASTVTAALKSAKGVSNVKVDLASGLVTVGVQADSMVRRWARLARAPLTATISLAPPNIKRRHCEATLPPRRWRFSPCFRRALTQ